MAEFEELRLSVVLVDNATTGLQNLNRQLVQLGGNVDKSLKPILDAATKQMRLLATETRETNKAVSEIRRDLERFGNTLYQVGQSVGLLGQMGAIGGLIGIIGGINSALGVFGQKMLELREASTSAGLLPDQFQNIALQLETMGYTSEQANAQVIKFFRNLNELTRTGTPEFERMRQLTAAGDRNAVFQFAKNLQAMVNRGEGEKAIAEAAAEVQRIFNRELAKPGGTRAEATRQAEAAAQVFGLDPERVQFITKFQPFGGETEWAKRIELGKKFKEQMVLSNQAFRDMIYGMQQQMLPTMIELNRWADTMGTTWGQGIGREIKKSIEDVKEIVREITGLWNFLKASREDVERRLNEQRDRQQGGGGWLPDWFKNLFSVTPAGAATLPGGPGTAYPGPTGPMGQLPGLPPQQPLPRTGPVPTVPAPAAPPAPTGPPAPVPYSPAPVGPGGIPVPRPPSGSSVGPGSGPGAGQTPPTGGTQTQTPGGFGPMPPGGFGPPTGRFTPYGAGQAPTPAPYGSSVGPGTGSGAGGSTFDERFRGEPGFRGLVPGGDTFDERFRGAPIPGPTVSDVPSGLPAAPTAALPPPGQPLGAAAAPPAPPTLGGYRSAVEQRQGQLAGTRKLGLKPELVEQLDYAANKAGVRVEVYSGGQAKIGTRGPRTGSTRHDEGGAADLRLYDRETGRLLDMRNPADAARMKTFAQSAVQAGATGIGAGVGYMGPHGIHIGGGRPAYWGGADWIPGAFEKGRENVMTREQVQQALGRGAEGGGPTAAAPGRQGAAAPGGWPTRAPMTPWPGTPIGGGPQPGETPSKFANVRYSNPGAMYPGRAAQMFGTTGTAIIGGGHKIADFPSPVHGAAANMQNITSGGYVGMTIGAAGRRWTGGSRFGVPGYDSSTVITPEMTRDPKFMIPFMKAIASGEAPGRYPMDQAQWEQAFRWYEAGGVPQGEQALGRGGGGIAVGKAVPFLTSKDVASQTGGWTTGVGVDRVDRSILDAGMGREMGEVKGTGDLNVKVTDKRGVGAQEGTGDLFQPKPVERMTQHEPAKEGPSKPESTPDPIDLPEVEVKGGEGGGDED